MGLSKKKIQIEMSMFLDVYKLIFALQGHDLDSNINNLVKRLEEQINAKLDAMEKRDAYTQSKVALSEEEREKARQRYLDLAGIHNDFRYDKDCNKEVDPKD